MLFSTVFWLALFAGAVICQYQEPLCKSSELRFVERLVDVERDIKTTTAKLELLVKKLSSSSILSENGPVPFVVPPLSVAELEVNGWSMVFRATAGNGASVFDAWTKGTGTTDQKPASMERSLSSHYRDPGISNWSNYNIQYVKIGLYEGHNEVAYVIFNAQESDNMNWFQASRVIASSWTDVTASATYNVFSIDGYPSHQRRFHINQSYGGCPADIGYLVVSDKKVSGCEWDKHPAYPQFLYSKINSADYWERLMFGRAEFLAVFAYF